MGYAGLEIGLTLFATDRSMDLATLAREAESRGFASLYVPEHTHIPTSRVTPWGGRQAAPPLPDGLTIEEVTTEPQLADFVRTLLQDEGRRAG